MLVKSKTEIQDKTRLGSVAGPVIQATWRTDFENDYHSGGQ